MLRLNEIKRYLTKYSYSFEGDVEPLFTETIMFQVAIFYTDVNALSIKRPYLSRSPYHLRFLVVLNSLEVNK